MKSVVIIAHSFPPESSAGVYRPLRFVRHLPDAGWHPAVVCCDKAHYERYDPELLTLIPPGTVVRRVRGQDLWQAFQAMRARRLERRAERRANLGPVRASRLSAGGTPRACARDLVRRLEAWCYHPDLASPWIRPAAEEAARLGGALGASAIYGTAGPVSAFVVAHKVSRVLGVPYVMDFRDAWTITHNDFEATRPKWAQRRDRHAMWVMLEAAKAVVFRYHAEAECYWRAYPGALQVDKIHIIPNGFDGEIDRSPIPRGSRCRCLYTGTLSSYRYDTLLEALRRFKQSDPERARRLSLLFVGEGTEALNHAAKALDLGDIVECRKPVPNREVGRLQRDAHALLVLGRPSTMKGFELFAGAKIFEYLKANRPIVGCLPLDETRRLLDRVGVRTVADVESVTEIVAMLRTVVDAWASGGLSALVPDPGACAEYSAERQTAHLARALEGSPPLDPFIPGAVEIPWSLRADIDRGETRGKGRENEAEPVGAAH